MVAPAAARLLCGTSISGFRRIDAGVTTRGCRGMLWELVGYPGGGSEGLSADGTEWPDVFSAAQYVLCTYSVVSERDVRSRPDRALDIPRDARRRTGTLHHMLSSGPAADCYSGSVSEDAQIALNDKVHGFTFFQQSLLSIPSSHLAGGEPWLVPRGCSIRNPSRQVRPRIRVEVQCR